MTNQANDLTKELHFMKDEIKKGDVFDAKMPEPYDKLSKILKEENKDTMHIWDQVCKTDPENTKQIGYGSNLTAIFAQSQRKKATEIFGPFGQHWGVKDVETKIIEFDNVKIFQYDATFYYPLGEFPINSTIEIIFTSGKRAGKYNEDFYKKVSTDALTKGLSFLGFNADVFEGKFDDNKYVKELNDEKKSLKKGYAIEKEIKEQSKNIASNQQNDIKKDDVHSLNNILYIYSEDDKFIQFKDKINEHLGENVSIQKKEAFIKFLQSKEKK